VRVCEFCGAVLLADENDICAACLHEQRQQLAIDPQTTPLPALEGEALVALSVLNAPAQHSPELIAWARGVLSRYIDLSGSS